MRRTWPVAFAERFASPGFAQTAELEDKRVAEVIALRGPGEAVQATP